MENSDRPGTVYLIGAGPGDPRLITVRGRDCIRSADVIVYDYLANPRLLAEARPQAKKIYVGKRGSDHTAEQEEINKLLAAEAMAGLNVARLKGGDAFIFGRGGEEALYLAERGIPFTVVPGVSSAYAVPAYAGIPVTHRGLASDVSFITGHEQAFAGGPGVSWEALAKGGGTLVFLMGVKNLPAIVENLLTHGKPAATPVAAIRWGTLADQETLTGSLGDIVDKVRRADFHPPAVLVVGEVVRLREKLAWLERQPLFGRRILVTRAAGQAGILAGLLEDAGAEVIEFPTIDIQPVADYSVFDAAVRALAAGSENYDWAVFTSANAVAYTRRRLAELGLDVRVLAKTKIAAVGSATAEALEERGLRADLVPADFRAEGLIAEFAALGVGGRRILIPRAAEAREILVRQLEALGAQVTVAPVYRNVVADTPVDKVKELLNAGHVDLITFTSGSTVKNFSRLIAPEGDFSAAIGAAKIAVIGPVTAEHTVKLGVEAAIMPEKATIPALIAAIREKLGRR